MKQPCVEWWLVSEVSGLVQVRRAKRRESRVTRVRGAIASLAPHFHREEAPRRRSWVVSKLHLFKTLSPSWTLLLPQLPPPGWSQAPRPLRVTPVLWAPPLWGSLPLVSSLLAPLSVDLGSGIPSWPLPTSDQGLPLGRRGPCSEAARPRDLPLSAEQHREGSPEQEVLRHGVRAGGFAEGSPASLQEQGPQPPTVGGRDEADLKGRWASGRSTQLCTQLLPPAGCKSAQTSGLAGAGAV